MEVFLMKNQLVLNSNNIGVNTMKESLLKKKKKGFTLVELIAVIAILAILAAIIVPRVANYTASATSAKSLANAKTLAQAVEMYQTDKGITVDDTFNLTTNKSDLYPTYISTWPDDFTTITAAVSADTTNGITAQTAGTYGALKAYIQKNATK